MTRTEELLKLCEEAEPYWYGPINGPVQNFNDEVTPPLLKQLVELVRLQNEVINAAAADANIYYHQDVVAQINNAIVAFNKLEGGE